MDRRSRPSLIELRAELSEARSQCATFLLREKVDALDLAELIFEASDVGEGRLAHRRALRAHIRLESCNPVRDCLIVGCTDLVEGALKVFVGVPLQGVRFEDACLASPVDDFAPQPRKVFAARVPVGEHIDAVLERDGPDTREAPPDLDAEIRRIFGDLVNQKKPGRCCFGHPTCAPKARRIQLLHLHVYARYS